MARQSFPIKIWLLMATMCLLASDGIAVAQQSVPFQISPALAQLPAGDPSSWAGDAARNELNVIEAADTTPLRYRQRKAGSKGDSTREVIETRDGDVARLVERNGQPLSSADDAAERARLLDQISSPDSSVNHHRKDHDVRDSAMKLVAMMPQAMVYSYTPGQPQRKNAEGLQVVLDFHPNPAFHPPTMFSEALTGLEGRIWIDARSHYVTRIEAHVLHPVNMGFGLVAKIFPGGTVALEQTHIAGDHWVYSHVDEHLTARVLLVKTLPENNVITSWDFRPLPSLVSYQDGVQMLLAMPVPVH